MNKPYWNKNDERWMVKLSNGTRKVLGPDPRGASYINNWIAQADKKGMPNPPPPIVTKWQEFTGSGAPKTAKGDIRIGDLVALYLAYLTHPDSKYVTSRYLNHFLKKVGNPKVSTLTTKIVADYLHSLKKKDGSPVGEGTKANACSKILACLNWAKLNKSGRLIDHHNVQFDRGDKPVCSNRLLIFTPEQMALIESNCNGLLDILVALRHTGCRPGELIKADIAQLKGRILTVGNKTAKKTKKATRDITLSDKAYDAIKSAIGTRESGPIFLAPRGGQFTVSSLSTQFGKILSKLGFTEGYVPYTYRHTWFSFAVNKSGANLILVAKLGGHTDLNMMFKVYHHEDKETMLSVANKVCP